MLGGSRCQPDVRKLSHTVHPFGAFYQDYVLQRSGIRPKSKIPTLHLKLVYACGHEPTSVPLRADGISFGGGLFSGRTKRYGDEDHARRDGLLENP